MQLVICNYVCNYFYYRSSWLPRLVLDPFILSFKGTKKKARKAIGKPFRFNFFMISHDMKFLSSFGCKVHIRLLSKKVFSPTWVREAFCHSIWREDVIIIIISQTWPFTYIGVLYSCLFLSNLWGKHWRSIIYRSFRCAEGCPDLHTYSTRCESGYRSCKVD